MWDTFIFPVKTIISITANDIFGVNRVVICANNSTFIYGCQTINWSIIAINHIKHNLCSHSHCQKDTIEQWNPRNKHIDYALCRSNIYANIYSYIYIYIYISISIYIYTYIEFSPGREVPENWGGGGGGGGGSSNRVKTKPIASPTMFVYYFQLFSVLPRYTMMIAWFFCYVRYMTRGLQLFLLRKIFYSFY